MKTNLVRNNPRKAQANTLQSKTIHSQSPTHKKLLKKIELTQREAPNQYDMSLQDNLVFQKPQAEVVDFRVEIERRFQKSIANHTYIFPRNKLENYDDALDDSSSSHDSSIDSLRHVTVYELVSQNKKRIKHSKSIYKAQDEYIGSGRDNRSYRAKDQVMRTEPDQDSDTDGDYDTENPETPIEIRIRDKNSSTYKKLLHLLEKQLNRPPSTIPTGKRDVVHLEDSHHKKDEHLQVSSQKPSQLKKDTSRDKMPTPNAYVMKNNLVKDDSQRKLGYHIGKYRIGESEIRNTEKSESGASFQDTSKKVKKSTRTPDTAQRFKVLGRDKGNSVLDASHGGGDSQISLDSRLSPKAKKALNESAKLSSQDSKKKLYNVTSSNGLLRALTPKALASKNILNLKDKVEKNVGQQAHAESYLMPQQTPSSNLYQKAQDDVLNGKLRISSASTQKATKKTAPSTEARESSTKRDKEDGPSQVLDIKGINFVDFYGSPKSQTGKSTGQTASQSVYNNFAKMRNIRKIEGNTGDRSSERQNGYVSYDLVNKNSATKPAFKLDLSNRVPKQRDMLSSTRTRENQSKEKSSDLLSIDSILKGSYEHSLGRNTSAKHLEASKKKLGITPKGNISKTHLMS